MLSLALIGSLILSNQETIHEPHLTNIRQLTHGGQNAEAYWSLDCSKLIFQANREGFVDDQIMTINADGTGEKLVSTGKGRCTCSYYLPSGRRILFSSTHATQQGHQPPVDMSHGYVWMVNPHYVLYSAKPDGTDLKPLIKKPGAYVAETTIAPNGKYMVFTSDFEGDLEIYRANLDGTNIKRLTHEVGYDGGPFVSWDSKHIVYRRTHFDDPKKEIPEYKELLKQHLVRPTRMDIWIMDADGSHKRQLTSLPGSSFAPFLHPNNKKVIFASNYEEPKTANFSLYMVDTDGKNLEKVTQTPGFNSFAMFSRDGKKLVFISSRGATKKHDSDIFVADWVD